MYLQMIYYDEIKDHFRVFPKTLFMFLYTVKGIIENDNSVIKMLQT